MQNCCCFGSIKSGGFKMDFWPHLPLVQYQLWSPNRKPSVRLFKFSKWIELLNFNYLSAIKINCYVLFKKLFLFFVSHKNFLQYDNYYKNLCAQPVCVHSNRICCDEKSSTEFKWIMLSWSILFYALKYCWCWTLFNKTFVCLIHSFASKVAS